MKEANAKDLRDLRVLITGGTDGIGKAVGLAGLGAEVVVVGRNPHKGEAAVAEIRRRSHNGAVGLLLGDLSAQAGVRGLADGYASRFGRLDVLVNNAGVLLHERSTTADGLETTLAVNHLAPFLLTELLLPLLKESAPARVVNVASGAHRWARLDLDDLQSEAGYGGIRAYNRSKLAVVLFTRELARRLRGTGVVANAFDPGPVCTGLLGAGPKGSGPPPWRLSPGSSRRAPRRRRAASCSSFRRPSSGPSRAGISAARGSRRALRGPPATRPPRDGCGRRANGSWDRVPSWRRCRKGREGVGRTGGRTRNHGDLHGRRWGRGMRDG